LVINEELSFVFVHVPKTAGQAIHRTLPRPRRNPWLTHANLDDVEKGDKFAFGFTRNPWDRMVSLYFFILQRNWPNGDHYKVRALGFKKSLFERKLGDFSHPRDGQNDSLLWLNDCDYVGRFETLQEDFNKISELIGIERRIIGVMNESKHSHYRNYYDAESIDFVSEIHKETIDKFGYEF